MARTMYGSLVAAILSAVVIVGCGEKIPADLVKTFDDLHTDIVNQVGVAKTKLGDLQTKLQGMSADTTRKQDVETLTNELKGFEIKIGDAEKALNDLKNAKDSIVAEGKADEFAKMMETAKATFDRLRGDLTALQSEISTFGERMSMLSTTPTTLPTGPSDTAQTAAGTTSTVAPAGAEGDVTKATDVENAVSKKADEAKKAVDTKADDAKKAVNSKIDEGKNAIENLKPNTNPK